MTALEFVEAGVTFDVVRCKAFGPKELLEPLRAEVARRVALPSPNGGPELPRDRSAGVGRCDVVGCGEPIPEHCSGDCLLCMLAATKRLDAHLEARRSAA